MANMTKSGRKDSSAEAILQKAVKKKEEAAFASKTINNGYEHTMLDEEDNHQNSLTYLDKRLSKDTDQCSDDGENDNERDPSVILSPNNLGLFDETSRKLHRWWSNQNGHIPELPRSDSLASVENMKELRLRKLHNRRLVEKDGKLRVVNDLSNMTRRKDFVQDIFTTCVEMRWRFILLAFASSFLSSWLIFAGIWHLMFYLHGDLEEDHLPDNQEESGWTPCVYAIYGFSSTFLFSVETQHTIGYGLRGSSHKCPDTIILQCIQSVIGVAIQATMAGIVFAKLARPKKRAHTIYFSKVAVISLVNGKLRLMFRAGNVRNSLLLESHFRAELIGNIITKEGATFRHYPTNLTVSTQLDQDSEDEPQIHGTMFLPTIVSHVIDSNSPLYDLSPTQLAYSKIEIAVTLEGIVEPSGNTTQVRTSYLPNEIKWGYTFANCVTWVNKNGYYLVDHSKLDAIVPDETPRISAKRLHTICSSFDSDIPDEKAEECSCSQKQEGSIRSRQPSYAGSRLDFISRPVKLPQMTV